MKNIIKFEAINDRISKLRIRGQISNTTLICVYAPTEVDTNEKKKDFYETLIRECEKTPKYDTLIILGDLNAQVGKEDHIKTVAGKHTIHEKTNDNGNRICNLAAAMNLYLASTKFPHPTKHKITWNHPNHVTKSQIDHVLITKKRLKNIENVRSYRGATADTDHVLVIATIKEKKSVAQDNVKNKMKSRWNTEKIKDVKIQQELQKGITQKLQQKRDDELKKGKNGIEEEWYNIKTSILVTAEEWIGEKKWIRVKNGTIKNVKKHAKQKMKNG
ncbi:hypothetical protein RN001_013143 [Aquatica leii]|uniref:Craniofacial development protein 2-like n=1 Tax=Aquatica leii TaxID=1421715 RepID=A0AAN7QCW4_9COLE|nr:hypothetical protein RN001_013143 [Aquatica leii]